MAASRAPDGAPNPRRNEKIALALGAGGARGLAQIGVIQALQARGLQIVAVAGSSSGALVGGIFAAGRLAEFHARLVEMDRGDFLRLLDPVIARPALFRGGRLIEALTDVVGNPDIESLPVDFTAVAVDLQRQREVWLRSGPLWTAIRASIALPGVLTPFEVHGRDLVDGGLLAPLPIAATRLSDAHRLIAVDMHGWPKRPPGEPAREANGAPSEPSPSARLGAWVEKRMGGRPDEVGMTELLARSLDTMQAQIARVQMALDPPEMVIRIPRDACQFYEFWRARELVEIGRIEADKALDAAGY